MSKAKKIKPETVLAKADEDFTNELRDDYPQWDDDAARYGRRTADYNAGFMAGSDDGREEVATKSIAVFEDLSARISGRWTNKQRRAWDKVYSFLKKHANPDRTINSL
jgi:hypothetical protein